MSLTYVVKVDCHRESSHTHWIQGKHQGSTFIYVAVKKQPIRALKKMKDLFRL